MNCPQRHPAVAAWCRAEDSARAGRMGADSRCRCRDGWGPNLPGGALRSGRVESSARGPNVLAGRPVRARRAREANQIVTSCVVITKRSHDEAPPAFKGHTPEIGVRWHGICDTHREWLRTAFRRPAGRWQETENPFENCLTGRHESSTFVLGMANPAGPGKRPSHRRPARSSPAPVPPPRRR